jgi:hypothetical protein
MGSAEIMVFLPFSTRRLTLRALVARSFDHRLRRGSKQAATVYDAGRHARRARREAGELH